MKPVVKLPVGIENFEEIRTEGFYYVDAGCRQALAQIEDKAYETRLRQDGMETILKYGIACNKKRCKIQKRNMEEKTS